MNLIYYIGRMKTIAPNGGDMNACDVDAFAVKIATISSLSCSSCLNGFFIENKESADTMNQLKVLGICGSLRRFSTNMGLLRYARENAPAGMVIELADLSRMPFYNADITEKADAVTALFKQMQWADAFLFGCTEYNYSMAPALKNALDWASREPKNRLLAGKPAAVMGAGGGMGSARAQYHLRQVCVYLDLKPINKPEVFSNAKSDSFDAEGRLVDTRIQELIARQMEVLMDWAAIQR